MVTICVDFDGTLVHHEFPKIGGEVPEAFRVLSRILNNPMAFLILYTMRSGASLHEAVDFCSDKGVSFWAVNRNPDQGRWSSSPKVYAQYYIDDAAVGCPLITPKKGRPYVDWLAVEKILVEAGVIG